MAALAAERDASLSEADRRQAITLDRACLNLTRALEDLSRHRRLGTLTVACAPRWMACDVTLSKAAPRRPLARPLLIGGAVARKLLATTVSLNGDGKAVIVLVGEAGVPDSEVQGRAQYSERMDSWTAEVTNGTSATRLPKTDLPGLLKAVLKL